MTKLTIVQEWYGGRSILVTGGTGFMGKVLLEKMLRDLPTIEKIYILVRPKKGLTPNQRLESIKKLPVFFRVLAKNPDALNKLHIIEGSLSEDNLGLSESDQKKLIEDVSVVFHMAASLRLEAGIKDAVIANTLGTQMVMELCKKMKKIVSVNHLSTAFCHCELETLEEKVYVPQRDPYEMIKLVLTEDESVLINKKNELIAPHPNSYTFSKRLAEWVAHDYRESLPMAILRPSIVIPALKDPTPGWVDSLNGPVGIMVAAGKGVLRTMLCNESYHAEVITVDVAINALVVAAHCRGISHEKETMVFNVTTPRSILNITWGEVLELGKKEMYKYPLEWMLWYPDGAIRTNVYMHWIVLILFQWIPAILLDTLFFIIRKERFMIRVQKKIMVGLDVLQYFTLREWSFETHRSEKIIDQIMTEEDMEIFNLKNTKFDIPTYITTTIIGARKYLLKENLSTLPITRIHLKVLYVLDRALKFAFYYYLAYCMLSAFGLLQFLSTDFLLSAHHSLMGVNS